MAAMHEKSNRLRGLWCLLSIIAGFLLLLIFADKAHALAVNCTDCHDLHPTTHKAKHDKAAVTRSWCATCHDSNMVVEHTDKRSISCEKCHSLTYDATIAKGAGASGTLVTCNDCHGNPLYPLLHSTDHLSLHEKVEPISPCRECHSTTLILLHRNDCERCHTSTKQNVIDTINTGKGATGVQVNCMNCHGYHDGPAAHNKLSIMTTCSGCHSSADFMAIKATHKDSCVLCHTSTRLNVVDTINAGKGAIGIEVTCENCHFAAHDNQAAHNALNTSVNCSNCHNTASFAGVLTTHTGQCTTCHGSVRAEVVTSIAQGRAGLAVTCENCHLFVAHDGPSAHNNLSTTVNCSSCHASAAFEAILSIHRNDCTKCHNSLRSEVIGTINAGKGQTGTPVSCENCHAAHDGNAVHNNFVTSTNCSKCHFGTITIHDKFLLDTQGNYVLDAQGKRISTGVDCALCHTSSRSEVIAAIYLGKGATGVVVNCENCHNGHAEDHNMLSTVIDCSGCHKSDAFQEIYGLHRTDCLTCHNSTRDVVQVTINLGMQDKPVNCSGCHTAHEGGRAHNNLSTSVNCSKCHMSATFEEIYSLHKDDCSKCHSSSRTDVVDTIIKAKGATGIAVNCENCHNGHGADKHNTLNTVIPCSTCHSTTTFDEIYTVHRSDCGTCHFSRLPDVVNAIKSGAIGSAVDCITCHGNLDHRAGHDKTFLPTATDGCSRCHVTNVAIEHVDKRKLGCVTCHSSTDPIVLTAINNGMEGVSIYCADCHGATNHNAAHDQTSVPGATCSNCHYQDVAAEHVDRRGLDCLVCHGSADPIVFNAIDSGMAGNLVDCTACHGVVVNHDAAHTSTTVPSTNCLNCHNEDVAVVHITERNMSCSVCHENKTYIPIINLGKSGVRVTCDQCHGASVDHTYAHNHAVINSDGCDKCHATDVAVEHVTNRLLTCFTCHSSTDPTVKNAIATAKNGTDVYCTTCHTTMTGHSSAHDMTVLPETYCADCHVTNVVTEHVDKRQISCSACHSNPAVAKAIADGRAGMQVNCYACHPTVDHMTAHNMVAFPTTQAIGCATCHNVNVVAEHVEKRALSCLVCHGNTAYAAIITSGMNGAMVTCDTCHGQPQHHVSPDAQNGRCVNCHTVTAEFKDAPVQGACRQCHINASNFVQGLNPTRVVHAYNTLAKITDFGACVTCHVPTTATFKPYHAKPKTNPNWWDTDNSVAAPGRGSFNIFYNEYQRPEKYYKDRSGTAPNGQSWENYGENTIKPRRGLAWSKPAISYNWAAVSHAGVSYTVPTFDQPVVTTPTITSLDRTSAYAGTTVKITGINFGSTQGSSYVLLGTTTKPTISSWSATSISFRVPFMSRGTYQVKVVVNGVSSGTMNFTIN